MPDRLVRDELLDSDRYLKLSSDTARLLFVHFLLVADDLGNAEAGTMFIQRRLLHAEGAAVSTLLSELADHDLLRLYEVDGKRYAHIPRFRQRLRFVNGKHPRPPAQVESQEIKQLIEQKTGLSQTQDGLETGLRRQKRREEKRSEVKRSEAKLVASSPAGISADASPPVICIPLNNNTEFPIQQSLIAEWQSLYPECDVSQTLREIRGWNLANPTHRKTKSGVLRHINTWLAKEQNRG